MKYIDEYRNQKPIMAISNKIRELDIRDISIMEICGGQTHTILKYSIEELLPKSIRLIHGPGCPVCVTPVNFIDTAINISKSKDFILTSYGDMLRVPGSESDLLREKAEGADIRMVYSPLDAVKIAQANPAKNVVFFAIGFETTAPMNAISVLKARELRLKNYFLLCSNVLVPPAIEMLCSDERLQIDGLLAAGHVCTVMGLEEYQILSEKYKIPIVATGFEPLDILSGVYMTAKQISESRYSTENQYSRAVNRNGNIKAQTIISKVFEKEDREWRGIGTIPKSGLKLKAEFSDFDVLKNFDFFIKNNENTNNCIAGEILLGLKTPGDCPFFSTDCNPEHPFGAPMVSNEGACAAYFRYKKNNLI